MDTLVDIPQGLSWRDAFLKRTFDLVVSSLGLVLSGPIIALAWILSTIDTRQNGFFMQRRVGRHGRIFKVIKIRTMRSGHAVTTCVTTADDPRITRIGRVLRKAKVDELPQLINVLKGDMSLVGPRPDVPGFADQLQGRDRVVLSVRPGITGPATLKYRDEEHLLRSCDDPERYNREVIFPDKVKINRQYVENYSFKSDLALIWETVWPFGAKASELTRLD